MKPTKIKWDDSCLTFLDHERKEKLITEQKHVRKQKWISRRKSDTGEGSVCGISTSPPQKKKNVTLAGKRGNGEKRVCLSQNLGQNRISSNPCLTFQRERNLKEKFGKSMAIIRALENRSLKLHFESHHLPLSLSLCSRFFFLLCK